MADYWETAAIEAGLVLTIASYIIAFGLGAYVGWSARGALGALPLEKTPQSQMKYTQVDLSPRDTRTGMVPA
jgi:hypothetical protein